MNSHACGSPDSNIGIELAYVLKPIFHNILLIPMNKKPKPFMPMLGEHVNYNQEVPNQPITGTPIGQFHIDQTLIPFDKL